MIFGVILAQFVEIHYICTMNGQKSIIFARDLSGIKQPELATATLHILCHRGELWLTQNEVRHHIVACDYAIMPNLNLVSQVVESNDFSADIMYLSDDFIRTLLPHNDYGIFGHLSLLQNPVMPLNDDDYQRLRQDIGYIRQRLPLEQHFFYDEMMEHLVMVHVLNLYDIHARQIQKQSLPKRAMEILQKYIALLEAGNYVEHRELAFYADRLCITPHYLSEVCRMVTGEPATYWIDLYMQTEVARLLRDKTLSFVAIADRLGFSSASYFTRYVHKMFRMSPSDFRSRFK